ncbi:MAG: HelD family protein [Actinomycetota bacterium]
MTDRHPDFAEEQSYIDHAYACLDRSREDAWKMRGLTESGMGGTMQNRFERNAIDDALVKRLTDLDLGDAALVFGRIDRFATDVGGSDHAHGSDGTAIESFHIGRLAVSDDKREPVVVDWRAPVAEPFYRATGREPMGLARRRHFAVQGSTLLGIEDELFGEGHLGIGHDEGLDGTESRDGAVTHSGSGLRGYSTLLASIERGRTGQLGDIVATIQAEQDEIIRSPQAGVLVVQGGPGTGKTVVALHRAAYLLYTNRFPLEDQGVLVIGPNRVFLRYIERVLPSLGEAGIEQVVLQDLVPDVLWVTSTNGTPDSDSAARVKGDERMSDVVEKAVRDRQRPLRDTLKVPFRSGYVRLSPEESERIIKSARRRFRRHNAGRRWVEGEVWSALAHSWREGDVVASDVREALRRDDTVRAALERMGPLLTTAQLLHDLYGSRALLKLAGVKVLSDDEIDAMYRPRSEDLDEVRWTVADAALLDEARVHLGPKPGRGGKIDEADEIRTYGHIVIDEVQDLTPMQLAMVTRRSLSGSMTVVGDLAQATGPHAPATWDEVLDHLPDVKQTRVIGLSVGYRIPGQIMDLANKVMDAASPGLRAPTAVREGVAPPLIVGVADREGVGFDVLANEVIAQTRSLSDVLDGGNVAVVVPDAMAEEMSSAFTSAGVAHGRAVASALDTGVTIVPVSVVKGLELDGVIVVEPATIVDSEPQGMRSLYVALTRATQRLVVVHSRPLPEPMRLAAPV